MTNVERLCLEEYKRYFENFIDMRKRINMNLLYKIFEYNFLRFNL